MLNSSITGSEKFFWWSDHTDDFVQVISHFAKSSAMSEWDNGFLWTLPSSGFMSAYLNVHMYLHFICKFTIKMIDLTS